MEPQFDGRAWTGIADAYGTTFVIELFESKKHPGFYHYAAHCLADGFCEESIEPVSVNPLPPFNKPAVLILLETLMSKHHGLVLSDVHWQQSKAEDLMLSGERVKAGD